MSKANIDNLASEIMKELMEFKDLTEEEFEQIAKEVAKEGTKKLKSTSPKGRGSRKGHYATDGVYLISEKEMGSSNLLCITRKSQGLRTCWKTDMH